MSTISRTLILVGLMLAVLVGVAGCGSGASNNDQGTSVTNVGFFAPDDTGFVFPCELFQTLQIVPLFSDFRQVDTEFALTSLGVLNNLESQSFRISNVTCDYDVPGASIAIPSDSHPGGQVLAPTNDESGIEAFGQFACVVFEIVTPDIYSFLNNNQNSMPQLPFRMNVECRVTGVTQAGDTITTNPVSQGIQFYDIAEGNGPSFNQGPGTGGDIQFETDGGDGVAGASAEATDDASVASDDFEIQ